MNSKRTLVLGASTNPERYSNRAILSLQLHGHEVYAIGLRSGKIKDCEIVTDQPDFGNIDTVTVYINPDNQHVFYDYIIKTNPKRVIFNPGSENLELENLLHEHGIHFIHACTLVLLASNQY
ncbi:MAG: CoA-binding protein [Bacteroidota bacterium]